MAPTGKGPAFMDESHPLLLVVEERPQLLKLAPLAAALAALPTPLPAALVQVGPALSETQWKGLYSPLGLSRPHHHIVLNGPADPTARLGEIMGRFSALVAKVRPRAVVVTGDRDAALGCALAAVRGGVPTVRLEAGLRHHDREQLEEQNRVLLDQLGHLLLTTESRAEENLVREGIPPSRVRFVGNPLIDSLRRLQPRAPLPADAVATVAEGAGLDPVPGNYLLALLSNPEQPTRSTDWAGLWEMLRGLSGQLPLLAILGPAVRLRFSGAGVPLSPVGELHLLPPLGTLPSLGLIAGARLVLTDTGCVQEETTALGVPCLTLRNRTERRATVEQGSNRVVGREPTAIRQAAEAVLGGELKRSGIPELWDGRAGERIAQALGSWLRVGGDR